MTGNPTMRITFIEPAVEPAVAETSPPPAT